MPMRKHNQRSSYIFTFKNTSTILCSGGSKECRFPTFLNLNMIFKRATTTTTDSNPGSKRKQREFPPAMEHFKVRDGKELVLLGISGFALEV
jgi:hypothetical protein